jgi:hypothetical protein
MFPASMNAEATAAMSIGDLVIYHGRQYVVLGLDPMGVTDRCAELRDLGNGETVRVPIDVVEVAQEPPSLHDV